VLSLAPAPPPPMTVTLVPSTPGGRALSRQLLSGRLAGLLATPAAPAPAAGGAGAGAAAAAGGMRTIGQSRRFRRSP